VLVWPLAASFAASRISSWTWASLTRCCARVGMLEHVNAAIVAAQLSPSVEFLNIIVIL
jgi:hypothetical protein